ncbi:MAG: nucleotidyltransferase domain-containing protein [Ruminococcus sp.]|uniref:nucleotidyltransferase domain-containing protein n=1 Tax=Schaedlerella arabinosiphila TaxID=2044587 RepID=UPI002557ED0E|nr:nucleotidyltransferase domain-containing protein [Schaedlerella arabinosiphila]MCI9604839.1 nucleotidyltransferase domain-containing protein [Ruminococcus sp.]MCI9633824.1 nucleotidyltransferase domain-containing protein [Ruminococcus sp.]
MDNYHEALQKLVPELVHIFRDSIYSIILYGSVANGTSTPESDVDIAVILNSYTKEMRERMLDIVVDLELEFNKVLSVLLIDYDKFREWENVMPFYRNIKQEGIILWPAV